MCVVCALWAFVLRGCASVHRVVSVGWSVGRSPLSCHQPWFVAWRGAAVPTDRPPTPQHRARKRGERLTRRSTCGDSPSSTRQTQPGRPSLTPAVTSNTCLTPFRCPQPAVAATARSRRNTVLHWRRCVVALHARGFSRGECDWSEGTANRHRHANLPKLRSSHQHCIAGAGGRARHALISCKGGSVPRHSSLAFVVVHVELAERT